MLWWEATRNDGFPTGSFGSLLELAEPGIHFGLRLIRRITIVLLEPALQLGAAAFNDIKIVIGQLAPLRLNLAAEFLPVPFDLIRACNSSTLNSIRAGRL
jgi:hypothetical protein